MTLSLLRDLRNFPIPRKSLKIEKPISRELQREFFSLIISSTGTFTLAFDH